MAEAKKPTTTAATQHAPETLSELVENEEQGQIMGMLAMLNTARIHEGKQPILKWTKPIEELKKEVKDLPDSVTIKRGAKSMAIRDMDKKGVGVADIARLLGLSYSHVYSVLHPWNRNNTKGGGQPKSIKIDKSMLKETGKSDTKAA